MCCCTCTKRLQTRAFKHIRLDHRLYSAMCLITIKEASISNFKRSAAKKLSIATWIHTRSQISIWLLDSQHTSRRIGIFWFSRGFETIVRDEVSARIRALKMYLMIHRSVLTSRLTVHSWLSLIRQLQRYSWPSDATNFRSLELRLYSSGKCFNMKLTAYLPNGESLVRYFFISIKTLGPRLIVPSWLFGPKSRANRGREAPDDVVASYTIYAVRVESRAVQR